jgi:hypothetical protein
MCEAIGMRAQSPIATTPSVITDGRIAEFHLWAVHEGLRRAPAASLFEAFCHKSFDPIRSHQGYQRSRSDGRHGWDGTRQ